VLIRLEQSAAELKAAETQAEEADVRDVKTVAAAIRNAKSKLAAAQHR
jgi:NADP-dependent 3-hydroxy acid dehydrogenase YdfG